MDYEQAGHNLAANTALWAGGLLDPTFPIDRLGGLALNTSRSLRLLGILALLAAADDELFRANLSRSGTAWCHFLQRVTDEAPDWNHHRCSGRIDPLLDTIASGDYELALAIARLAPTEKNGRSEYEDDYCFARCLFALTPESPLSGSMSSVLARWSAYEGDRDAPRLAICRALHEGDNEAFLEAFSLRLDQHAAQVDELVQQQLDDTPLTIAPREIFVEGLALLRIADERGMVSLAEYPSCPTLARRPQQGPFARDFLADA